MCCYVNHVKTCVDFKGAFVEYKNTLWEGWSPRDLWSDITREYTDATFFTWVVMN